MASKKEVINYVVSSCVMNELITTAPTLEEAYDLENESNGGVPFDKLYVYKIELLGELKKDFTIVKSTTPQV